MGIAVLGPLQVDGHPDGLGPRDRVVLSALVVRARESVSTEALADALWGDQVPVSWATVVYGCVWRLRKALGSAAIDTSPTGYILTLSDDELDHRVFERLLERGREALESGDSTRSSFLLAEGLGLWRGRALAELQEWEPGRVEAARLEGMRRDAEELRLEAEVRAGRALAVLERARALVAEEPFRERRWALLATALYQSGRQREALGAVKRARTLLVEELGLDPGRELVDLEQRLLRHDPSLAPGEAGEPSPACPYRGLQPYDLEHADTFFGREDDLAACLRRLRDSGVLAVVGPSGVGKSSLVRAGVVAALTSSDTSVLLTTPGARPLDSLKALMPRGRQTLVVDQAEEAVTLCSDPAEQADYFTALASHVGAGGGLVVSLRADHIGDLVPYSDIARTLEEGLYLLGPMREPALRRAIEGPARRAGLRLEAGLVDLLVRDVEGQPAGLPMLSHVLRETWERREGSTLTIDGYKATGGIQHAVSQSAETLYDAMDEAQRGRLRSLLLRLVMPTEDGEPVRARVARDRVTADEPHRQLVEQLVGARLLSIDGDTVQIAHEALVRVWPRLRGWLDDDIEGQRLFRHLAGAAEAWDGMGRPDSELYRGARLSRTLEWRDRSSTDLTDAEAAFLSASVSLSEKELRATEAQVTRERQVSRRLRRALAGVAGLLVVSLVTGALALHSADQAGDQRARAERLAAIADAGRVSAQARNQEDLDTSILLQLAALRIDSSSAQAREGLAATLGGPWPQQIKAPTGASGNVRSVAVSGDGKLVASSDPVDGVQLYDAATMSPVAFADDTPASVVRFSPDGTLLAAAVNQWRPQPSWPRIVDLPVRLYDLPSGRLSTRQLGGWPAGANVEYALAFSRDGRRIVAGVNRWDETTHDWTTGAVMVWDVAAPAEPVFEVALPDEALATLSPDGRLVFTATKGEQPLRVYDVASGTVIGSSSSPVVGSEGAADLEVSPDGSTLAVGARGQVLLLDASTLTDTRPALTGHAGAVQVAYSHDGSSLLSMSLDSGDGILWDTDTWTERRRLVGHVSIQDGGFSPDDTTVYTGTGHELMVWEVAGEGALMSRTEASTAGLSLSQSLPAPDGGTIARTARQRLWFVDSRTGRETTPVETLPTVWAHVWSPDSRWLLTTSPGVLSLWDASTGRLVAEHATVEGVGVTAAFSADGELIHVFDPLSGLETLDRATLDPVRGQLEVGALHALLPHPRDATVFGLRPDGSLVRIDPETGRVDAAAPPGTLPPGGLEWPLGAWSPDGSRLAAPHPDGGVALLDPATWAWTGVGSSSTEFEPRNLAYSPDGSQVATAEAGWIRIWDGRTGAYVAGIPLPGPSSTAMVAYRADGTGLLVAARDGRTWVVDTRLSTWVDRACAITGRNLTREEWQQYLPNHPYVVTCPQWPAGT